MTLPLHSGAVETKRRRKSIRYDLVPILSYNGKIQSPLLVTSSKAISQWNPKLQEDREALLPAAGEEQGDFTVTRMQGINRRVLESERFNQAQT